MKNILLDTNIIIQFKTFETCKLNEGVELSNVNIYITDVSLLEIKSKMKFKDLKNICYIIKKYDAYLITLSREKLKINDCRFIYNRIKTFSDLKEYEYLEKFYDFYNENFHSVNKEIKTAIDKEKELARKAKELNLKIKKTNKEHVDLINDCFKNNKDARKKEFSKLKQMGLIKIDLNSNRLKIKNKFNVNEMSEYSKYFTDLIKDVNDNEVKSDFDYYHRILKIVCNLDRQRILLDMKNNNHKNMANDVLILTYSLFFKINLISADKKMLHKAGFFYFSSIGFFPIPILIASDALKTIDKVAIFNI